MKTFTIFCRFQPMLQSQQSPLDSFMDHTTCCAYNAVFSRELSNAIWKNDIKERTNLTFFSYTIILFSLLRNIMVICYGELLVKD